MISVEEALNSILQINLTIEAEECPIQSALGRVLATDILATHDQPPWDNSAMDGYAVRWEDIQAVSAGAPVLLKIIEVIPCGDIPRYSISKGKCSKIMTGAQIPRGADTVIPVEVTEKKSDEVLIKGIGRQGDHIRLKGEDVHQGEAILNKGKQIRSPEIAMLASSGMGLIPVFKKPKVAILSTGDELAELDAARPENKIFNANGYALYAQVLEADAAPVYLGISSDSKDALWQKIKESISADVLIISGGVSMGDFDFVKEILTAYGKINFWKVAMRPGAPMVFGELNGKPVFGLPGNPVSCMVTFKVFVEPFLKKIGGMVQFRRKSFHAVLSHEIKKKKGLRYYQRGILTSDQDGFKVKVTGEQGSHLIHSMVKANCLIDLPEHLEKIEAGERISVIPF